jgi:antitoxin YefM
MQAITLKDAERNLQRLVEQVLADAEPRIVVTDQGGQVVVMPLDEFNSWKETMYLLSNPANATHLRRSISEAESGKAKKRELSAEGRK